MSLRCDISVPLADHPLLTVLGRRGRGAVLDAVLGAPERTWTVRDLARAAELHPMVASRSVHELAALGIVEAFRPGRAMRIRLLPDSAAARIAAALHVPDLRRRGADTFAAAYAGPSRARLVHWQEHGDDPADPLCPCRVAVLVRGGDDDAFDAVGPALDAVAEAGWPRPDVTVLVRSMLADDPASRAVRAGRVLQRADAGGPRLAGALT